MTKSKTKGPLALVHDHFRTLAGYEAADPPEVLAKQAGVPESEVVKLNANENPYGPSPKVAEALGNLRRIHIYPDPGQTAMREAVGRYVGLAPEYVVVGNGSDEIIDLLFRATLGPGDVVVDSPPTFSMYRFNAQVCGARTVTVPRGDGYEVDMAGTLSAAERGAKIIIIASPNNPTGNATPVAQVERLLTSGLLVIVDEAYHEFGGQSVAPLLSQHPNLVVLRTLSKWAGLAGLRVGYGLMAPELAEVLLRAKPPYNVNQAAEVALLASFDDVGTLNEHVGWIVLERERLMNRLRAVPGVMPLPSDANFVLFQVPEGCGLTVYEGLARRGVFVRYFSDPRLTDFLRVSVGTSEQTDRLIQALTEAIADAAQR